MTPDEINALSEINDRFIEAESKDAALAAKLNTAFHMHLLECARMPLVKATVENMWVMMGPLLRTFHAEVPRREIANKNHKHYHVLRALRKHDAEAARVALQADIRWSEVIIQWLEGRRTMKTSPPLQGDARANRAASSLMAAQLERTN
jgi:DNA-binding GntR family transcriptional regulator